MSYDATAEPNEFFADTRAEAIEKAVRFFGSEEAELNIQELSDVFGLGARVAVVAVPKSAPKRPPGGDRERGREGERGGRGDRERGGRERVAGSAAAGSVVAESLVAGSVVAGSVVAESLLAESGSEANATSRGLHRTKRRL